MKEPDDRSRVMSQGSMFGLAVARPSALPMHLPILKPELSLGGYHDQIIATQPLGN